MARAFRGFWRIKTNYALFRSLFRIVTAPNSRQAHLATGVPDNFAFRWIRRRTPYGLVDLSARTLETKSVEHIVVGYYREAILRYDASGPGDPGTGCVQLMMRLAAI